MEKFCPKCKRHKDVSRFSKCRAKKDGLYYTCKTCFNETRAIKKYYQNNRTAILSREKEIYQSQHERALYRGAKQRAKRNNLEFNISVNDIQIPNLCPILKIPLFVSDAKSTSNSPTLDRIDNNKGYIKDNIQVISFKANTIKNNATVEELEKVYLYLKTLRGSVNSYKGVEELD